MAKTTVELIADIDAQLEALIANPPVDYTEGDVSFKNSQKVQGLLKMREALAARPDPSITVMQLVHDFDEFGIDLSEYM
ncbi:MAG: hypothetical protein M0R74_20170 [Dehalococcoidia bacterium]|nr:hypothetical protein [Dehalococcoidia bacterium]